MRPPAPLAPISELADRLDAFATELLDPLICREPAYGAPGIAHCAACCGGTRLLITCPDEQAVADAAFAMQRAATALRRP